MSPDTIERAAEAAWNLHATRPWSEIPEAWKPYYRACAEAALATTAAPRPQEDGVADEERITDIIMKGLEAIEKRGFIVMACDTHGRDHVVVCEDGSEGCQECHADGGSGELCTLGLDSVAIELAEKIVTLRTQPAAQVKGGGAA